MPSVPAKVPMPDIFEGAEMKKRPAAVTILRELPEVFAFFRDFTGFPRFMKGIISVENIDGETHRWTREEEEGAVSWVTSLVEDRENECIAWRTQDTGILPQAAAVTFEPAPGGRGTVVRFKVAYLTATGKLEAIAARIKGEDPDTLAAVNLRRLQALLETGEFPTVEGQPSGREAAEEAA